MKKIIFITLFCLITLDCFSADRKTIAFTDSDITGNAATVTVADASSDTTTFPMLATDATGNLAPKTDAGLSYNADTNALTVGNLEISKNSSNTATVQEMQRLTTTSTGTVAANFGASIDTYLEDASGNTAQQASSIGTIWTTATHGSESSAITLSGVTSGGALTEWGRIYGASSGTGGTLEIDVNGLTTTNNIPGLILKNSTAATSDVTIQSSPFLIFSGQDWVSGANKQQQVALGMSEASVDDPRLYMYFKLGTASWLGGTNLPYFSSTGLQIRRNTATEALQNYINIFNALVSTATSDVYTPYQRWYSYGWRSASADGSYSSLGEVNAPEQGVNQVIGVHKWFYNASGFTPVESSEIQRLEWGENYAIGLLGAVTPQNNSVQVNGDMIIADQDTVGDEKITDGTAFASGWTVGEAWHVLGSAARKDTDGVTTLSQTSANMVTPLVAGETYLLSYVVSSNTVTDGSMVVTCGGATRRNCTTNDGTYTWTFTATSTADLVFTPSLTTSRFYIDNVSLKKITGGDLNVLGNSTFGDDITISAGNNLVFNTETLTFDGVTNNDFELSDDLNINDTTPHLRLIDTDSDDFELFANSNKAAFVRWVADNNITYAWKVDASNYFHSTEKKSKSFTLINPVAADDYPLWKVPCDITIRAIHTQCTGGTNIIGGLDEYNSAGATIVAAVDSDITATAGNSVDDDGSLTNAGITSGNYLFWHTTSISGTPTSVTVTFEYSEDLTW